MFDFNITVTNKANVTRTEVSLDADPASYRFNFTADVSADDECCMVSGYAWTATATSSQFTNYLRPGCGF